MVVLPVKSVHQSSCMASSSFPVGSRWQIVARKYDQSRRFRLISTLVADDGDQLLLHADAATLVDFYTATPPRTKPLGWHTDIYFWRTLPYNIFVIRNPDRSVHHFYCNVALCPTIIPLDGADQADNQYAISYVDMDIDVYITPNGDCKLLDLDEFREHSRKYGYTPTEHRAAYDTMLDIIIRWRTHRAPFDQI